MQGKEDSEEYGYIHDMITTYPVVVFAKTTCKFCTMAKDVLDDIGVSYCLENIENRDNMGAVQDMFGSLTGARTVRHSNITNGSLGCQCLILSQQLEFNLSICQLMT